MHLIMFYLAAYQKWLCAQKDKTDYVSYKVQY